MKIDLDRNDIINMIKGCQPAMSAWDNPGIKGNFEYSDQYGRFTWKSSAFDGRTGQELYELYLLCKNSYNEIKPEPRNIEEVIETMPGKKSVVGQTWYDATKVYQENVSTICCICGKDENTKAKAIYWIENSENKTVTTKTICDTCLKPVRWDNKTPSEIFNDVNFFLQGQFKTVGKQGPV